MDETDCAVRNAAVWQPFVAGSDGFAIRGPHVLFRGGYDHQDQYVLIRLLDGGAVERCGEFVFHDEAGADIRTGALPRAAV